MKLTCESELMKNQKHAEVMAPDLVFKVIQATTGDALFFSIGSDHVFYVTREVRETSTGWNRVDLSSNLSTQHSGSTVVAKSFAITQNSQTQAFDVALVVTIAGEDWLYISLGNSGAPDAWNGGVAWVAIQFDAPGITPPNPLTIADVYLMQIPAPDGSYTTENCFVDIIRNPSDPLQELDRYYITPGSSPQWNLHTLAIDLSAGSIESCLGNRTNDYVPGIYTFGSIGGTQELIYAPQYNTFRPTVPPNAARLLLPSGSTAIASALNNSGVTNLFVVSSSGLYVFTPDNQGDQATPIQVVTNVIFSGTSNLSASTIDSRTAVWGLNAQNEIYYVSCIAGNEADPGSWTLPIPICTGAEGFAFYLNNQASAASNELFAHLNGQQMLQLSQDSVTSCWSQRSLLIPSTVIDDMVEYYSFTTHIQVTDDTGVVAPNTPVSFTVATSVTVYINNTYYVLAPSATIQVNADSTGVITVVQETQSLSGACFRVTLTNTTSVYVDVNPMSKAFQTLGAIKSGDDLANVQITTSSGTTQPLLPSSASVTDRNNAASVLSQLVQVSSTLPSDGSTAQTSSLAMTSLTRAVDSVQALSIPKYSIGDLYQWAKNEVNKVTGYIVQQVQGAWQFEITIAGQVYQAILDSLPAIAGALDLVFTKLDVIFDDVVAWLGFLFKWDDIIRTHKVMKNIFNLYTNRAVNELGTLEAKVQSVLSGVEEKVNSWAGINDPGQTIGSQIQTSSSSQLPGINTPQANWALHQMKSNLISSSTTYTQSPTQDTSSLNQLIATLDQIATSETSNLTNMVNLVKTQIAEDISSLTPTQVIKRLAGIITDLLINSAETLIVNLLEIIQLITTGLIDLLNAPIDTPIISSIYKTISGGDTLTFLDLVCLIGAIPTTIIFKISTGNAPYPDNAATQALIDATDFSTLASLLTDGPTTNSPLSRGARSTNTVDLLASASPAASSSLTATDIIAACLDIGALFGCIGAMYFAAQKFEPPTLKSLFRIVRYCSAACYVVYVAPSFTSAWVSNPGWEDVMNDAITSISILKTFADNTDYLSSNTDWSIYISPFLEAVINAVWLVPDVQYFLESDQKASDISSYVGDVMFDVAGILTPGTIPQIVGGEVAAAIFTLCQFLTAGYGIGYVVSGITLLTHN